jgi:hypothetical protein
MGTSDPERKALKSNTNGGANKSGTTAFAAGGGLDPIAMRLPDATRFSGLSRSEIYRRAGTGEIKLLKCGATTLVDVASLRVVVAGLPRAVIRGR